ncbi:MAG TPA: glycerophosphodiester phosphodiesterase family protein [Ktedonobacterales bacterium]|jgi:glycerophosphoryl diester phosphodiesterase
MAQEESHVGERSTRPPASGSDDRGNEKAAVTGNQAVQHPWPGSDAERFTVFAHRGARAHAPENTLLALRLAFALGADAIECDVQLSADGALVIIHDDKVNRTTNGRGEVNLKTLAQLRALDAGQGQRIPTLEEVLDLCRSLERQINLEVKAETLEGALATAEALGAVLESLDAPMRSLVLVSSFELPAVAQLKQRLPWLRVATLHSGRHWRRQDMLAPALEMGAEALHPGVNLVSPELVRRVHQAGLHVHVWTANRWSTLRQLLAWGVDGVFTDYPERAIITRVMGGNTSEPPDDAEDQPDGSVRGVATSA